MTGVAQAVVDKAVRLHHDWYMSNSLNSSCSPKREDITLVLRNFNYPLPNAITSPSKPTVKFNPVVSTSSPSSIPTHGASFSSVDEATSIPRSSDASVSSNNSNEVGPSTSRYQPTDTNTSTSSSSYCDTRTNRDDDDDGGSDNMIDAYVDFTEFYNNYFKHKAEGTLPEYLEPIF